MPQHNQNGEPTIGDVLEAVNEASTKTEKRLQGIENRLDTMNGRMDKIDGRMDKIDGRMDKIDGRMDKIESTMVTKDYLDEKLADLKGDITIELRGEDRKLAALVDILRTRQVITNDDAKQILSMKPFPELSLR